MSDTLKLDPEQLAQLQADFTDALERALLENERLRIADKTNYRYYVALITQLRAEADTLRTQLEALRGVNQTLADRLAGLEAFADTHRGGPVDYAELTYGDTGTWRLQVVTGVEEDAPPTTKTPNVCKWTRDGGGYKASCVGRHSMYWPNIEGYDYCTFCGRRIEVEE